jgi:hypothetical protein
MSFNHSYLNSYVGNLTSYWNFDKENYEKNDLLGRNDFLEKGGVYFSAGIKNKGIKFNGENCLYVPANETIEPKNSLAVCFWCYFENDNIEGKGDYPISKVDSYYFNRRRSDSRISFNVIQENGILSYVPSKSKIKNGEWYFVSGILENKKIKIYVNGKLEGENKWDGTIDYVLKYDLSIGTLDSNSSNSMFGIIDEISFWGDIEFNEEKKSDNFVLSMYNYGSGNFFNTYEDNFNIQTSPVENSSSSEEEQTFIKKYKYGFFRNSSSNLLNSFGGMTGPTFFFSDVVNYVLLVGYSGNKIIDLKLQNADTSQIISLQVGKEIYLGSVGAGERLRVLSLNSDPSLILNSYELKFRKQGEDESSETLIPSFETLSSESSQSSEYYLVPEFHGDRDIVDLTW